MNTDTTTNPVEHDTELLALLQAAGQAHAAVEAAWGRVEISAKAVTVSHTGEAYWSEGNMPKRCKADELAEGTLVWQSKTFTRGEGERFYVTGAQGSYSRNRRLAKDAEIVAAAEASDSPYAAANLAAWHEARQAVVEASQAIATHEQAYTGWNRYFLVVSSAGHVHSSMHCSTCNPRTQFAPVVALSGKDDADAVAELGETLCSVCFPDAPVSGKPDKITAAKARKLAAWRA